MGETMFATEATRLDAARGMINATRDSGGLQRGILSLAPGMGAFDAFDDFARSLPFLSTTEACTLIVAGDEIIDNLLTHGEIGPTGVTVLVRKRSSGLTLAFFVGSHKQFADFSSCVGRFEPARPRFDERERRWHGLGLTMCRNLASSVDYRPGLFVDRVILIFNVEPASIR